jgi:hypothetical protein
VGTLIQLASVQVRNALKRKPNMSRTWCMVLLALVAPAVLVLQFLDGEPRKAQ